MGVHFMDQFSLLHFATGVVMYFWGISLSVTFVVHTLFEIIENTRTGMRFINTTFSMWPGGKPHADSIRNSIGDTVFAVVGWLTSYYLDVRYGRTPTSFVVM